MPDGNAIGNIRPANHLTIVLVVWIPRIADQECGRLLGGFSVIVSKDMRIGLQEEPHVGVPDPLADDIRAYAGFERTCGVGVPQIVKCPDLGHDSGLALVVGR
jgi:hypothetical protein